MDNFDFGRTHGRGIVTYGSSGASIVPLHRHAPVSTVTLYLEPGGLLGRHPAAAEQLLLVVAGNGWASAGEQRCQLSPGTAVLCRRARNTKRGPDRMGLRPWSSKEKAWRMRCYFNRRTAERAWPDSGNCGETGYIRRQPNGRLME